MLSLAIAAAMMAAARAGAASAYNPETGKTARYITYDPALAAADKAATIAAGLRAPGTITYDREGVPVIQAANDLDAAYLLGYAHARDRFFQRLARFDETGHAAIDSVCEIDPIRQQAGALALDRHDDRR